MKALDGPQGFMQQYCGDRIDAGVKASVAVAEFKQYAPSEDEIFEALDAEAGVDTLEAFAQEHKVLFAGVVMIHDGPAGTEPFNPFGLQVRAKEKRRHR